MTEPSGVRTRVSDALEMAGEKRRRVRAKRSAFGEFEHALREIPAHSSASRSGGTGRGTVPTAVSVREPGGDRASEDRCLRAREAFAGTIEPCLDDAAFESLSGAIEAELGTEVALVLDPRTDTAFSPPTKDAMVSAAADRQIELSAMERALEAEIRSLRAAVEGIGAVTGWIADADETPLSKLGFAALRARHEALSAHRSRCEGLVSDRQAVLDGRSCEGEVVLGHRTLVGQLYTAFPAEYPVLATSARLIGVCEECQHAVRAHLVRRV